MLNRLLEIFQDLRRLHSRCKTLRVKNVITCAVNNAVLDSPTQRFYRVIADFCRVGEIQFIINSLRFADVPPEHDGQLFASNIVIWGEFSVAVTAYYFIFRRPYNRVRIPRARRYIIEDVTARRGRFSLFIVEDFLKSHKPGLKESAQRLSSILYSAHNMRDEISAWLCLVMAREYLVAVPTRDNLNVLEPFARIDYLSELFWLVDSLDNRQFCFACNKLSCIFDLGATAYTSSRDAVLHILFTHPNMAHAPVKRDFRGRLEANSKNDDA